MRALRIASLTAMAFALAGCGAKEKAAAAGADLAPASTPCFISIDSNLGSGQWQQLDELLDSFPGKYVRSWLLPASGLDYDRDVKPALGEELDLVWLDFERGGENVVGITKPKDEAAFRRMIEKRNKSGPGKLVLGKVGGWTVIADSQHKVDRFREEARSDDKLADDDSFKEAMAQLQDEALVKAYVKGADVVRALRGLAAGATGFFNLTPEQRPEFLAAGLAAEKKGLRFVGVARTEQEPKAQAEPFESKLVDDVPADAVAFLTFRGGSAFDKQRAQLNENPTYREGLRQLEQLLGFPFGKLLGLFKNEVAFYVRPGSPIPELTLLLEAPNEQQALRTVDQALAALARSLKAQPCHAPPEQAGIALKCIDLGRVELRYAAFDRRVVVTTGPSAIEELRSRGPKLSDDKEFRSALDAASAPDENNGLLYVDLKHAIPLVLGFATAADAELPGGVEENLRPLRSLVVWGSGGGRTQTFTVFLGID